MAQGFNWLLLFAQLQNWWDEWWQAIVGALTALALIFGVAGCGPGPNMTDEQRAEDVKVKMLWLDKVANLAERHNLAWQANLTIGGRPRIGTAVELYLDTDTKMTIAVHANAAAARPPTAPKDEPGEDVSRLDIATEEDAARDGAHTPAWKDGHAVTVLRTGRGEEVLTFPVEGG